MASRRTLPQIFRLDIIGVCIVVAVAVGLKLGSSPWVIGTSDPEVVGAAPPAAPGAGGTVLVAPTPSEASTFSTLDMGYGWYNTLTQEVGPVRVTQLAGLPNVLADNPQLLVIAGSAARATPDAYVQQVASWVRAGGVLLLEQPGGQWRSLTGHTVGAQTRPTRQITAADGSPLRGALRDAFLDCPVPTTIAGIDVDESDAKRVLMEVDGHPALVHVPAGSGHIYLLTIDLARAITTLQQGRPEEDFSVPGVEAEYVPDRFTQPYKLVASEKMLKTRVPYADLLERNIMEITAQHRPQARMWYFPGKFQGVYVMSHDEESFGDRSLFITDWEAKHGHRTSNFIIPGEMTTGAIRRMAAQGHDVQVHWNRGFWDVPVTRPVGLGPWKPIALELNLADQIAHIERQLGTSSVTINRLHGLTLDRHWSSTFRKLAAARIAADSSYGPTGDKQFGYLFGTGRPFYPMDTNGLLLPVAQIPFVLQDDENLNPAAQRRLVKGSETGLHQVVMPIYHSNTMANRPKVPVMETWRSIFRFAERHGHWVTTLQDFLLFDEARRTGHLSSTFDPKLRRLEIRVTIPTPRLRELDAKAEDATKRKLCPSVSFPQTYRGEGVQSVTMDGDVIPLRRLGRSGDGFYHVLPTTCGEHVIYVTYTGEVWNVPSPLEKQLTPR